MFFLKKAKIPNIEPTKSSFFDIINFSEHEKSYVIKLLVALGLVTNVIQCLNHNKEFTKFYSNRSIHV